MKTQLLLIWTLFYWLNSAATHASQVFGWGAKIARPTETFRQSGFSPDGWLLDEEEKPLTNVSSVSAGFFSCLALRNDGAVIGWSGGTLQNANIVGVSPKLTKMMDGLIYLDGEALTNVQSVAAGNGVYMALNRDGTVIAWESRDGRFCRVDPPMKLEGVAKIAAGERRCFALQSNGVVRSWGPTNQIRIAFSNAKISTELTNVSDIAAGMNGYSPTLALTREGRIIEWNDLLGDSNIHTPPNLTNIISIASGSTHCVALRNDGRVFEWPNHHDGTPVLPVVYNGAVLNDIKAIAAGKGFSLALTKHGRVVGWGPQMREGLKVPEGLSNVVAVAAGDSFCLALVASEGENH